MKRVLIVRCGEVRGPLFRAYGEFDAWFRRPLSALGAHVDAVAPFAGDPLPDPRAWRGVLLTGSLASVRDEAPWMGAVGRWALEAADAGVAVLGVCFGHQLLGEALGGGVEQNPAGPELGTVEVRLTPEGRADPLFEGLPDAFLVQESHDDAVVRAPEATRLAGNAHTPCQAFAAGDRLRSVQFHPEMTADIARVALRQRRLSAPVCDAPDGARVLANWYRNLV